MELSKNNFVFTTKIELDGGEYVTLRELDLVELENFQSVKGETKQFDALKKLFPVCLVESSFTIDGQPATGEQLAEALSRSSSLYTGILTSWINSIPFQSRLEKNTK